jgi:2-hydroxychromene-2-carboxylate isomerase
MPEATRIDFYLDFLSPFGYLARQRVVDMATRHGVSVCYHPVDLVELKKAAGNTGPPNRAIPPKIAYLTEDLQRWARRYGLPMERTLAGANTARMNKGLLLAIDRGEADDYACNAWDLVWRDGQDPGLLETLHELAARQRWSPEELLAFVDGTVAERRYRQEAEDAAGLGVFGVPTFIAAGQMFWGNDRLDFLEEHLSSLHD